MVKKKTSFSFKLSQNLVQLLIVMAGVFLGMLLTEWNLGRKTSNKVGTALKQIRIEILANQKMLDAGIMHKKPFFSSLDSLESSLTLEMANEPLFDKPLIYRFPGWKGIGSLRADDSMYQTAMFSNVFPEMDIELVRELALLYNTQNEYNKIRETLMGRFLQMDSSTTYGDALRLMWQIAEELGAYELMLQDKYKVILDKLENYS